MKKLLQAQSPARLISLGFAAVILIGSVLLILPCSVQEGVELKYIDSLYTSTSAVCVTGLIAVDAGDTFTPIGQFFLALLIQIGGLGVTSIGAGVILAMGRKLDLKGRRLIREASNLGKRCADNCWNPSSQTDRGCNMARCFLSQCLGKNSRLFNLPVGNLFKCRTFGIDRLNVYRRFSRFYRRRY